MCAGPEHGGQGASRDAAKPSLELMIQATYTDSDLAADTPYEQPVVHDYATPRSWCLAATPVAAGDWAMVSTMKQ